jgi:uroporphyrinogen-III synthase
VAAARRVIVTRPAEQAAEWVQALGERGLQALALPLIGIAPAADPAPIGAAWAALGAYSLLVFVSPNAVTRFFAHRPADHAWPEALRVASPGPGTTAALLAQGVSAERLIEPAADAAQFDSESLWQRLGTHRWRGERVLIVRGEGGRAWLAEQLEAAGAEVRFLAAYQRAVPRLGSTALGALTEALVQPQGHLWLFSSSEAIGHLVDLLPVAEGHPELNTAVAITTHPRIAERAREAGFGRVLECRPSVDAVVACIQSIST